MRRFALVFAMALAGAVAATTSADAAGGSLTVPVQVEEAPGARAQVQVSFTYAESTPFCTNGVNFTWDGAPWLSELPARSGNNCVATGAGLAPDGHSNAGAHQVCGTVSAQISDCKSVTLVVKAGATVAPNAAQSAPAGATPATGQQGSVPAGAAALPTATPAPTAGLTAIRSAGTTVAVLAALAIVALVFAAGALLRLRKPKPTPGGEAPVATVTPMPPPAGVDPTAMLQHPGMGDRGRDAPPDHGEPASTAGRQRRFGPSGGRGRHGDGQ